MTLIAGDLLADAEALAYPYVNDRAVAPGPLLRTLSTLDAEVTGMVVSVAPHLMTEDATPIDIVYATNPTGYTLEAARSYVDFKYESADKAFYPVRIVPMKHLDHAQQHPAAVVEGSTLFPVDTLANRWQDEAESRKFWLGDGDKLHYRIVAPNVQLTALADTLVSPDYARQYFTWTLTYSILLAFHGVEGIVPEDKLTAVGSAMAALQQSLWQSITNAAAAESSVFTP